MKRRNGCSVFYISGALIVLQTHVYVCETLRTMNSLTVSTTDEHLLTTWHHLTKT